MSAIVAKIMAKVTRAKQHVQDFDLAIRAFHDSEPYRVSVYEEVHSKKRIYYLSRVDPIPDSLTAIAADVIQNLRSPLDQIAYQLVLDARGGTEPDWKVYYPICGSVTDYPFLRTRKIKGVRQEVIDAIDATEPYKGGKGHALWQLNELSKPDKHRLMFGAGAINTGVDVSPTFNAIIRDLPATSMFKDVEVKPLFLKPREPFAPMKVGDHLYVEPIWPKVNQKRPFTFEVSFDVPGVVKFESALKTLRDMTNLVGNVTAELGRFLR